MSMSQLIVALRNTAIGLLQQHLADLTDADLLVRPAPAANHALWQLTHLVRSQVMLAGLVSPETPIVVPPHVTEAGGKAMAGVDDPAKFPTRAEVMDLLDRAHAAIVAGVSKMSDQELSQPPPEHLQRLGATVGALVAMVGSLHIAMHLGQVQVLRRKLGKPNVF
jgi:hypothetical protein